MDAWELNLRAAIKRMLDATPNNSDTVNTYLVMSVGLDDFYNKTLGRDALLTAAKHAVAVMPHYNLTEEQEGALQDIKDALGLWAKEDELAPYEPDPVNEGYEMSGRDCDRAAGMHFGNLNAQHP